MSRVRCFKSDKALQKIMVATTPTKDEIELRSRIHYVSEKVKALFGRKDEPNIVVSPYRMNPLGAHIDHQGGAVLARTIDQYTVLAFYPLTTQRIVLHCDSGEFSDKAAAFDIGSADAEENWIRFAMASANSFAAIRPDVKGFSGMVHGSLVGAGLSSSASVILAYLRGLAHVNNMQLNQAELVELTRQVENDHMGLNNGLQDQMSIVFGRTNALSLLHMETVTATYIPDPATINQICWVICYSGFSRELLSSGFNDRVRECREAATLLDSNATHLGEVATTLRGEEQIAKLPAELGRRATHVYSEMLRVTKGCEAWACGDWPGFGELMNQSCHSSIANYECGSEAMIELHNIALKQPGVFGSRFGGGGYGGCLMMLVEKDQASAVQRDVLQAFLSRFPDKAGVAKTFLASAENNARVQASGLKSSHLKPSY